MTYKVTSFFVSNRFSPTRPCDLPSHRIFCRFTIPSIFCFPHSQFQNKAAGYPQNSHATSEPLGRPCLGGHMAFHIPSVYHFPIPPPHSYPRLKLYVTWVLPSAPYPCHVTRVATMPLPGISRVSFLLPCLYRYLLQVKHRKEVQS